MAERFDVIYQNRGASIGAHYCREWDENGGCYGTNEEHGLSFDEACAQVAEWHEQQARLWREHSHPDALWFVEQMRIIAEMQQDNPNETEQGNG